MTANVSEMLPCPFCYGKAFLYQNEHTKNYYAGCINEFENCQMVLSTKGFQNPADAIGVWNKRGSILTLK